MPVSDPLELQVGDVVFIRVGGFLYGRVAAATGSWTSHVGVLHHCENGRWWVAESAIPRARLTPLDKFLSRSERGRFAIRRLRGGLTPDQVAGLVVAADKRLDAWYDLGFNYDSRRQFCSKFVHAVYTEAVGFGPGQVERFVSLLNRQPGAALSFWRWWFAGRIPMRRRTVTPASQLLDERFETVLEGALGESPSAWRSASGRAFASGVPQSKSSSKHQPLQPGLAACGIGAFSLKHTHS